MHFSRCDCTEDQIGDGFRCYGNLMERLIELDVSGSQRQNLSGAIALFGKRKKEARTHTNGCLGGDAQSCSL